MKYAYILSAAFLALLPSCNHHSHTESARAPRIDVGRAAVDSLVIHKSYPGVLSADKEVQLVARVDGYLKSKNYSSGDYVRQGAVLFTIEDRNYRDAVSRAQSDVATAQANLDYASSRYDAITEAFKGDAVSRMEVVQAKSNLEECRAALESARAALRTAQTQLSYCTVRAPFAGRMSSANYDVGSFVGGSAEPVALASIYADDVMVANFSIDDAGALESLKSNIAGGTLDYSKMPLTFSETLSRSYTGALDYMSPKVNTSTGTLALQATIDNPDGELRSGMYVEVDLPVKADPRAIVVRDASIATDQLGKYVYTVNDSDIVVYTPVETGELVDDSLRIITSGLSAGQRYVTKALLKVRQGMKVEPVE